MVFTKDNSRISRKNMLYATMISLAFCIMLFIYAPLEIYFNNKQDFWYDFSKLLPICLLMFTFTFALSILFFIVVQLIHPLMYDVSLVIYTIAFLCCYIQGNYMVGHLPSINGAQIDWSEYGAYRLQTIILWIVITLLALLAIKFKNLENFKKAAFYIGSFFSMMLLLSLFILGITTNGTEKKWDMLVTDQYEFEMSTDKNYIILMLDAIDGDELSEILATHPQYSNALSDFTYYDDVMSAYPYTELCVPFLFSGKYFENTEDYEDYLLDSYINSPLFNKLESLGYRMGLYEPDAPLYSDKMYRFENVLDNRQSFNSLAGAVKIQLKLVGMKYMPHDLKRFCQIEPGDIPRLRQYENGMSGIEFWESNPAFYAMLNENPITLSDNKCFRFIHIEGAHLPYRYDAEVNMIPTEQASYTTNVEASMTIAMKYLQILKDSGVYDNSAIIIMSDHGYNRFEYDALEGRQHPVLFAKGFYETNDKIQICKAPVAHEDFLDMADRLLEGAEGSRLTDYKEGDNRDRRYLLFKTYDHIKEYIQTKKAHDMDTLIPTGNEYNKK